MPFKFKQASLAFSALMLLTGCGRTSTPVAAPPSTDTKPVADAPKSDFKVALVMSGQTSDNGWNAGAFKALKAIRDELKLSDADSPYVENASSAGEQEKNLRAFAAKNIPLVFGHGHEYEDLALRLEKDYPNTMFVISSGGKIGKNTMPIVYKLEDGAYLLGMLAAGMSKSNTLGLVGAMRIPPVKSVFSAFEAGAKAIKPNIKLLQATYTNSWDDVGKAKEATIPLIDQGADVIMQDVDAAAQGVFKAVQERNRPDKPVYALGTNSNQNDAAPDVVLGSAPIYSERVFVNIAKAVRDKTLKANDKPFGMPEGVIDFILNPKLLDKLPADLKTKIEETQKKIKDGSFVVPRATS